VTLADGKSIALTSIDLNNRTKYPITSECVVDLQTVRVDVSSNDKTSALPSVERRIPAQNKGKELLSTTPSKPTSVSSDAKIMRIAVLPFQFNSADEKYTWISKGVPDALTTELAGKISYQFIENLQRDKVLEEINFQQTKYVDEASAVRIGKLLGAQQVIVGSCQLLNNEMEINSRLIDVETGTIMKKAQVRGEIKNVFQLQKELADAWKKQIN
jgi:TolB-like protein